MDLGVTGTFQNEEQKSGHMLPMWNKIGMDQMEG